MSNLCAGQDLSAALLTPARAALAIAFGKAVLYSFVVCGFALAERKTANK